MNIHATYHLPASSYFLTRGSIYQPLILQHQPFMPFLQLINENK